MAGVTRQPPKHMQGHELNITINDELRTYVDPLTPAEHEALERSLLTEGCREALILWRDVLIDGHNRYSICTQHNIRFRTVQNDSFESIEDVKLWMIDNQLARRSVSDFQRGLMALRKKEILAARVVPKLEGELQSEADQAVPFTPPWNTREEVARAARVSANTISQIERIQKAAAPELVDAVRAGQISVSAAANVASLSREAQVAAVAGGKKELQQAARQVREQKLATKPKKDKDISMDPPEDQIKALRAQVGELKDRVATLMTENEVLKQKLAARGG
jgi:transcriptional regulator with XRE-family HTH domain